MQDPQFASASGDCLGARFKTVASSAAASASSTFSRASEGSAYLSLITSPCSVIFIWPSIDPHGKAISAS